LPSDEFTSGVVGATAAIATVGALLVPGSDVAGFFSSVRFRLCVTSARAKKKENHIINIIISKKKKNNNTPTAQHHTWYYRNRLLFQAK